MAEGGIVCAQIVLSIFNIIQFVFGWLLIIVGAVTKFKYAAEDLPNGQEHGTAIYLIFVGSILVVISIMGCIGAWTKNFCLLVTFSVLTVVIFILVVIAMIVAFVVRSKSSETAEVSLKEMITHNDTALFDALQLKAHCCGVNGPEDWKNNPNYSDGFHLPASCCGRTNSTCVFSQQHYTKGCKEYLSQVIQFPLLVFGIIAAVCAFVVFLAIFSAAYLANRIRDSYHAV